MKTNLFGDGPVEDEGMTPERLKEIECEARKAGSANCWTGTSGTLASMIWELLAEIKRLRESKQ